MPHECTNCGRTFPDGSKEMLSGCPNCGGNKFQFAPSGQTTGSTESTASTSAEPAGGTGTADTTGTVKRAADTVRSWVSSESKQSAEPTRPTGESLENRTPATDASHDEPDGSWPEPETPSAPEQRTDTDEFTEWPETARRPEDRSTAVSDESSDVDREHATFESASPTTSTPDKSVDSSPSSGKHSTLEDSENTAQADARSEVVSTADLPSDTPHSTSDAGAEPTEADGPGDEAGTQPPEHGRVVSEPSGDQPSIEELRAELNEQFESIKIVSPGQYELNLMELYNREEYIISLQEDGRYVIDVPDSWHANDDDE